MVGFLNSNQERDHSAGMGPAPSAFAHIVTEQCFLAEVSTTMDIWLGSLDLMMAQGMVHGA